MGNLEYSDFYKFLVSLGLVLIGMAALAPWAFLSDGFLPQLSIVAVEQLSTDARDVYETRVALGRAVLAILPWLSLLLAGAGGTAVVWGMHAWSKRQVSRDEGERLVNEKLRAEIRQLSPLEIVDREFAEALSEAREESVENPESVVNPEPIPGPESYANEAPPIQPSGAVASLENADSDDRPLVRGGVPSVVSRVQEALVTERNVVETLGRILPATWVVHANVEVGGVEYDAIVETDGTHPDLVVEVKSRRVGRFSSAAMARLVRDSRERAKHYARISGREAKAVLLVVGIDSPTSERGVDAARWGGDADPTVAIEFLAREDLRDLSHGRVLTWLAVANA